MKNKIFTTGLTSLVLAFFVLAGVGWADNYGDRYKGRHGDYRDNRHYNTWDRGRNWNHKRYDHRDKKYYNKWNHGRYRSYLHKDYRRDGRYWDKRYDHKYKVRPYYKNHPGKYYKRQYWPAKPYYRVPRHGSSFTFGTSFFDPGFFFGLTIRDHK